MAELSSLSKNTRVHVHQRDSVEALEMAEDERALIETGLPYLGRVWSNPDWDLYRVGAPGAGR